MQYISIAFGIIFLVAGYQLSWMFVAGVCALLMGQLIDQIQVVRGELERIGYALAAALGGSFLVYFLHKLAVVLAGLFAGGYLAISLPALYGWPMLFTPVQVFATGGVIAALLILFSFSFGTILVTSFSGAMLLVQNFSFSNLPHGAIFILLVVIGLLTQFVLLQYMRPDNEPVTPTGA